MIPYYIAVPFEGDAHEIVDIEGFAEEAGFYYNVYYDEKDVIAHNMLIGEGTWEEDVDDEQKQAVAKFGYPLVENLSIEGPEGYCSLKDFDPILEAEKYLALNLNKLIKIETLEDLLFWCNCPKHYHNWEGIQCVAKRIKIERDAPVAWKTYYVLVLPKKAKRGKKFLEWNRYEYRWLPCSNLKNAYSTQSRYEAIDARKKAENQLQEMVFIEERASAYLDKTIRTIKC